MDTSDFRNGMSIIWEGDLFTIVDFQHVKPGKGGAFVRTKLRNVRNGGVVDKTFRAGEKMDQVTVPVRGSHCGIKTVRTSGYTSLYYTKEFSLCQYKTSYVNTCLKRI